MSPLSGGRVAFWIFTRLATHRALSCVHVEFTTRNVDLSKAMTQCSSRAIQDMHRCFSRCVAAWTCRGATARTCRGFSAWTCEGMAQKPCNERFRLLREAVGTTPLASTTGDEGRGYGPGRTSRLSVSLLSGSWVAFWIFTTLATHIALACVHALMHTVQCGRSQQGDDKCSMRITQAMHMCCIMHLCRYGAEVML